MPVNVIWSNYAADFSASGIGVGSWTLDIVMDSPQTVYAFASLTSLAGGGDQLFCGVTSYEKVEGKSSMPKTVPVGSAHRWNVAPGFKDENVSLVTFAYGAIEAIGSCNFQVFGFGE